MSIQQLKNEYLMKNTENIYSELKSKLKTRVVSISRQNKKVYFFI